jgi:hypothetical protein
MAAWEAAALPLGYTRRKLIIFLEQLTREIRNITRLPLMPEPKLYQIHFEEADLPKSNPLQEDLTLVWTILPLLLYRTVSQFIFFTQINA